MGLNVVQTQIILMTLLPMLLMNEGLKKLVWILKNVVSVPHKGLSINNISMILASPDPSPTPLLVNVRIGLTPPLPPS